MKEAVKEIILGELSGYDKDEAENWFDNAENYSCQNGCIGALVYYDDTEKFARDFHDEIIELMEEYGANPMKANDMAWFGFEALVPTLKDDVLDEIFLSDDEMEETKDKVIEILEEAKSEKDGNINQQLVEILDNIKSEMEL